MSWFRWLPSFLGFPVGGWLAFQLVGSATSPPTAALAGAVAGTLIGTAQWLALRPAVSWHWIGVSTIGMGVGGALAAAVTGSATTVGALAVTGLIAGAAVGLGQGIAFRRGWRVAVLWTVTVGASWMLGWTVTSHVIVDADRGYAAFGSSGALAVTLITGLALRRILGPRRERPVTPAVSAAVGRLRDGPSAAGTQR
ncbi:hypothetical protein [Arthrobacter globiformis]|uniref:Uncharacterized protein n=1 Tax=Arthrobacter globiformis TaxID=1665 RepID=A0A328HES8_ARTGO|nr:hypothetical protein [Arthrobacter globiformis]RAM37007.1 hypothetical protein DBZ45_12175 [Arthrobacter globiformis]